MSLRGRIALLTIAATVVTVILSTALALSAVSRVLTDEVDEQLLRRVNVDFGRQLIDEVTRSAQIESWVVREQRVILVDALIEGSVIPDTGISSTIAFDQDAIPEVGEVTLTSMQSAEGIPLRIATAHLGPDVVIRAIRAVDDVRGTVRRIGTTLALLGGLVALLAAVVVWLTVDRTTRPVRSLARSAEEAGRSGDLSLLRESTADVSGRGDEVGELARSLASMSSGLEESRVQQRRLVDDAAHELRTPLTSLRTNLEFLQHAAARDQLGGDAARGALTDAIDESQSLGDLITELVTLASDVKQGERPFALVQLDLLVEQVVERARRRSGRDIEVRLTAASPSTQGDAYLLERAIGNLVGNAVKFSPASAPIRVTVGANSVTVEDGGPGIRVEDRSAVLQRFWRSPDARALPGSGLGLAIVHEVAQAHGGAVTIADSEDLGGAKVSLWLPLPQAEAAAP